MMRTCFRSVLALALLSTAAVGGETGVNVTKDVPYSASPALSLDIYHPPEVSDESPVLVYLFGSGFGRGSGEQAYRIGPEFAAEGVIVVAPDLTFAEPFPEFVRLAAKGVAHAWKTLRTSSGDPRSMFLSGWSSGAYITGLLSYDERYLAAEGLPGDAIMGFIGLSGPYWGGLCGGSQCPNTFPPGTEADWAIPSFVDPDDPAMLLVWGTRDGNVERGNLDDLAAAGETAGIGVTTLILQDEFHSDTLNMMGVPDTEVFSAAKAFIGAVNAR